MTHYTAEQGSQFSVLKATGQVNVHINIRFLFTMARSTEMFSMVPPSCPSILYNYRKSLKVNLNIHCTMKTLVLKTENSLVNIMGNHFLNIHTNINT